MIEGIYDAFTYEQQRTGLFPTCRERLDAIRAAGLRAVLNYGTGTMTEAQALRYANEAGAAGVRVIWNPWTGPATWSGGWIEAVRGHPATWGYYVGDEAAPGSAEAGAVEQLAARCRKTGKPTLYISRPGRKALRPFVEIASHSGPDCYPVGVPSSWAK